MRITNVSDREIIVEAPAKVNLFIRILDQLPNGYHELWSLMHTVALWDQLRIRLNPKHDQLLLTCGDPTLPVDRRNLVYQAAETVLQQLGYPLGIEIELTKNIPEAAGLGGGSSDAAATIYGLAQLLHLQWSPAEYSSLGEKIGSDVPFFFLAPSAVVRGWGNNVVRCGVVGKRWIVLVNPGFAIQTKWAYTQLNPRRVKADFRAEWTQRVDHELRVSWEDMVGAMHNDFEGALFPLYPILRYIKDTLLTLGAQASLLSGSGATVFGIFSSLEVAQQASAQLRRDTQWKVIDVSLGGPQEVVDTKNHLMPTPTTST